MEIAILEESELKTYQNLKQSNKYFTLKAGRHEVVIGIAKNLDGTFKHLDVIYKNASHRAWRGLGSKFYTIEDALSHYRTPEVKAMIKLIAEK